MSPTAHLALLALAWTAYGAIHSLLASTRIKQAFQTRFAHRYHGYRLGYNLLALALLAPPVWLLATYPGDLLWHWPAPVVWLARAITLAAAGTFLWTLRYYDTGEFLGTQQWRLRRTALGDQAPMALSPLHRRVRHPWYFLGLVILWSREMNAAMLLTACALTVYLVFGSYLEDRKLLALYGKPYQRYRDKVPGLIPMPGRYLSRQEAQDILKTPESSTPG